MKSVGVLGLSSLEQKALNSRKFSLIRRSLNEEPKKIDAEKPRIPRSWSLQDTGSHFAVPNRNSFTSKISKAFQDLHEKIQNCSIDVPHFRHRLVSKWESLNYDKFENQLESEERQKSKREVTKTWVSRWLIFFLVGLSTALLAGVIHAVVEHATGLKFQIIKNYIDKCIVPDTSCRSNCSENVTSANNESVTNCVYQPVLLWISINLTLTLWGAALVTYLAPVAAGSGIPFIKSYLNGVKIPRLLSLRTFIAKTLGVVLSIVGGLTCGKEGPMAHSGGIIAGGLGKGKISFGNKHISFYNKFRDDHEVRDFVAGGAASGVSAAFGAPVGGTLFSLEEAASFWNQDLTWRVFFAAMVACFGTNVLIRTFSGRPTEISAPGLIRFDIFTNLTFDLVEIPMFLVMGLIGGLIGAMFVVLNYRLTILRHKFLRKKWMKVVEAGIVSMTTAAASFLLMYSMNSCTDVNPYNKHSSPVRMFCSEGQHNSMSTLFLTTPEGCLKSLLHDARGSFTYWDLMLFVLVFFFLSVWTYGLSVSSGVFIPCLVIGAAWGRMVGMFMNDQFPELDLKMGVGKYALIGAASQLGGIVRTTISLTVIIVECTGNITFGLPIMIVLMISKWVGDFVSSGLYEMNVEVCGIPMLPWEPPPLCEDTKTSEIMSVPVLTLRAVERVGRVYNILKSETFSGFPIVHSTHPVICGPETPGKLQGLILRSQLIVLLHKKAFSTEDGPTKVVELKEFKDYLPNAMHIKDVKITDEERHLLIDLKPYMNPTPYTVEATFSLPRIFKLFRGLGLRHLIAVNDKNEPVGMVTRKDVAKFRAEFKRGIIKIEHLDIEDR